LSTQKLSENDEQDIWDFIPLAEFSLPSPPVTQKVKRQINFFRNLLKNDDEKQEKPFQEDHDLQKLPDWKLNRIAPTPDIRNAVEKFQIEIEDWLENDQNYKFPIITFISPPYFGFENILKQWSEFQNLECVEPPTSDQILTFDKSWFTNPNEDKLWVFPNLERAFLRHAEGLNLIRSFLDKAYSGELGKGIIGCNSWTWAYLNYLWRGRLPITLTIQAFDQKKLSGFFYSLSNQSGKRQYLYRQSDNGKFVISPEDQKQNSGEMSNLLQSLAAYSRGNPGVAWEYWRTSTRLEPDKIDVEDDEKQNEDLSKITIWITPWDQIKKPALPPGSINEKAIILHTLLLHNGLTYDLLRDLLPFSPSNIMETILFLEEEGLVSLKDKLWNVTPLGYPAIREFISSNGYQVDQF
jgi:hypothetical protein